MTAINFTNSPSNGDTTTVAGVTYTYNSTTSRWEITSGSGGGGSAIEVGITAPSTPAAGQLWWDSSEFTPYIYYTDTDSSQWVEFSPGAGGGGGSAIEVGTTAPSTPAAGQLWWDSSDFTPYIYYTDSTGSQWVEFSPGDTGSGGAAVEVGTAAPGSPSAGQLWWDSSDFTPYVYYNDGTSSQWVEFVATSQTSGSAATLTTARNIGGVSFDGSADIIPNIVTDTTPQLGGPLDVNGQDIVTISNGDIDLDPNGSGVVVFKGNATKGSGQFKLNCENNSHGITIKGPPHSAGASYTLTLPDDDGTADQVLKTDGSGALSWGDQGGVATYATMALLIAATGMTTSDLAFVTANNNLYLYTGTGWFKVATVENNSPSAITGVGATTTLAIDGTATVITAVSTDPEGFPLTWSYSVTTGSLTNGGGATAAVSQADNVFTITPTTTEAYAGTFSITFSATDGTNAVTAISAFTLAFGYAWGSASSQLVQGSGTVAHDAFGDSGDISGNTAIFGASYVTNSSLNDAGAAFVFTRSGTTWSQQQKLTPSDAGDGDHFGQDVAIDGNTVVVGSPGEDVGYPSYYSVGAIYVYTRSGTTWSQQAKKVPSDPQQYGNFGKKVAIDSGTIVVGATNYGDNSGQGAVYIFTGSGSSWSQQQKLVASDASAYDYFGQDVDIDGDTLVVGAYNEDSEASNAGAAYVYTRSGTTWTLEQKLTASDGQADDNFGWSVAIDGDNLIVGAWYEDSEGSNAGAAYVFTRSGTTWTQQQKLTASDGAANDNFGNTVAIDVSTAPATVVVGATGAGSGVGAAYVFTRNGTTWTQKAKLTSSSADHFGSAVGIDDDVIIVGDSSDDTGATNKGSATFFIGS
jgi:hypothetical protein